MKAELVPIGTATERSESADEIQLGQWYWLKTQEHDGEDEDGEWRYKTVSKLTCVMHIGSNYAELKTADGNEYGSRSSWRVHFNEWAELCTFEPNAADYIKRQIERRQDNVKELLGEVQRITSQLGIIPREAIAEHADTGAQALAVVSGTADVDAHKNALIKAKKETLPEIFKRIEKEHEAMVVWMKSDLLPAEAQLDLQKQSVSSIDDRIFTVELYAGLVEKLVRIRDGKPAPNDTKVALFQRRHYMDEECLANYDAGGMDYKSIDDFNKWLKRPDNFKRILPKPRSIVAFKVRRNTKERSGWTFDDFIRIASERDLDKMTFLYVRNGEQLWSLKTEIEFDEQLFPDAGHEILLGAHTGELWADVHHLDHQAFCEDGAAILTEGQYNAMIERFEARLAQWKVNDAAYEAQKAARDKWDAMPDEYRAAHKSERPSLDWPGHEPHLSGRWEKVNQDSVHYDDVMQMIAKMTRDHNRVATVLQGLLDRSPCLQPHPPWKIWTPEGYEQAIELVYDDSRALVSGEELPDFEAYRAQLNKSIKVGSIVVGQDDAWQRVEAEKYNQSMRAARHRGYERERHKPHGNPGPGYIAKVWAIGRNGDCIFRWMRTHRSDRSWRESDEPLPTQFRCPTSKLLCVDAYTPGDYKMFFADPRLRERYLEWAPFMLAAEDYHAGKLKLRKETKTGAVIDEDDE